MGLLSVGFWGLGLLLLGANLQGPGQFGVKDPGKYRGNVGVKPVRASALMGVKAVQSTPVFQFSDEWVSYACLCVWLEYGG